MGGVAGNIPFPEEHKKEMEYTLPYATEPNSEMEKENQQVSILIDTDPP